MMVRLISRMAGPGGCYSPGSVIDLPGPEAHELMARGYAVSMEPMAEPQPEGGEQNVRDKARSGHHNRGGRNR